MDIKWVSKYGIINPAGTDASTATANVFVPNDGTVSLNPYFDDGSAVSGRTNVTLANNEGVVTRIPHTIDIEFSNTTFGTNILTNDGNVVYRAVNSAGNAFVFYRANSSGVTHSFGLDGQDASHDPTTIGDIKLITANVTAQTGTLRLSNLDTVSNYTHVLDGLNELSKDKIR